MMCSRLSRMSRLAASVSILCAGGLLAGCNATSRDVTGSTSGGGLLSRMTSSAPSQTAVAAGQPEDPRRDSGALAERYRANPRDAEAAVRYAQSLRQNGQHEQAVAVLQQSALTNPRDKRVLGAYGRALADAGRLPQALEMLSRAHTPDQPDWRILSAQGAVLDQMGRYAEARRSYGEALKIAPNEPSVMSNLGLSYALSKDLPKAESTLRQASAKAPGDRRIRQNLALVLGLQGRFKEAEKIASADLPPAEAADNVAYLKQMLAQRGRPAPAAARAAPAQASLLDEDA